MADEVQYEVGDILYYNPWGTGSRRVRVTAKCPPDARGRIGFDAVICSVWDTDPNQGTEVWGYDFQITRVMTPEGGTVKWQA